MPASPHHSSRRTSHAGDAASFHPLLFFTFLVLCCLFTSSVDAGWVTPKAKPGQIRASRTIFVDQTGKISNFTTIQSAIDSIPFGNKMWIDIRIAAGVYREKVTIPRGKSYLRIKGKSMKSTHVIWDDHTYIDQSPTFATHSTNIIIQSISFRNSYNNPKNGNNGNRRVPAVAAMIAGDKTYLYRVGMYGLQDTLWDVQGRHYFRECVIQGAVDFIFGNGQSIYEGCHINVNGHLIEPGLAGFVTAHARTSPNEQTGFVFKGCKVYGTGSVKLGRPWRSYARVLFYHSNLTSVVVPKGWDSSSFAGYERRLTFAEHGCYGEGANRSARVNWATKMSFNTVKKLTSISYIDSDGWTKNLPI